MPAKTTRRVSKTSNGIKPSDLEDADLQRELRQLYRTRPATFFEGSQQSLRTHTDRMLKLEREYARRHPDEVQPDPQRTRAGARARKIPKR